MLSLVITLVLATMLVTVPLQVVRVVPGISMVFSLPGYLLLELLWPQDRLEGIWRSSLVVPVSIALIGSVQLILSYFWTYTYERALVLVATLNGILAVAGYVQCRATGTAEVDRVNWLSEWKHLMQDYRPSRWHALLAITLLVFLGSVAYAIVTPRQTPTLTEFYVLTEDGHLPLSPDYVTNSDAVQLGIHNLEGRAVEYYLLVLANTALSSTKIWSQSVAVPTGATVEGRVDLSSKPADTQTIQLSLFLPDDPEPYRSLRLALNQDRSS